MVRISHFFPHDTWNDNQAYFGVPVGYPAGFIGKVNPQVKSSLHGSSVIITKDRCTVPYKETASLSPLFYITLLRSSLSGSQDKLDE
ncbi:hypothetical protein QE390_002071 [Siphonobacter sp. SORGH_AS 1065]|nr:hypothetical protein [Siphonobacter sp. SORGH_AS_1065]